MHGIVFTASAAASVRRIRHAAAAALLGVLSLCLWMSPPATAAGILSDGEPPRKPRIIALGAPAVETLFALGLEKSIVARATWDDWPPAVREVPHIGSPDAPNLELILQLKPDMVLADGHYTMLQKRLQELGIPCELFSAYNTTDVIPGIEHLAEKLDCREQAGELIRELRAVESLVKNRLVGLADDARPIGLTLSGRGTLFSFSDASGRRLLQLAGAKNAASGMRAPYPVIAREWLLYHKPDFLLISPYSTADAYLDLGGTLRRAYEDYADDSVLSHTPTVEAGGLIVVDGPISYGLRSHFGVLYLAKHLHPERFADINPDEIYFTFLLKHFGFSLNATPLYARAKHE